MPLPLSPFAGALAGVVARCDLTLTNGVLALELDVLTPQGTYPAEVIALDNWSPELGRRVGTSYGADVIRQLLDTVGVSRWWLIRGSKVRIHLDRDRCRIAALHHFEDNGRSWDPVALAGAH